MTTNLAKFERTYTKLQKKYSLPTLDEINFQFEVVDIVEEKGVKATYPLRYIRRIMVNVFYGWINYLHNFIMPSQQSAILMKESEAFSEEEKEKVIKLIKEIMFINRVSNKLDLELDETKDAKFIKEYYDEWLKVKKVLVELATINVESWKKDMPKENGTYFG